MGFGFSGGGFVDVAFGAFVFVDVGFIGEVLVGFGFSGGGFVDVAFGAFVFVDVGFSGDV